MRNDAGRIEPSPFMNASAGPKPADKNYDGQWRNAGVKVKQGAAMARTKRGFYAE